MNISNPELGRAVLELSTTGLAGFITDLDKAQQRVGGVGKSVSAANKDVGALGGGLSGLGGQLSALGKEFGLVSSQGLTLSGVLGSIGGAIAGALSVQALLSGVRALTSWAHELEETATGIDVSIEGLQRLEYAWNLSGLAVDKGTQAIQMMNERLGKGTANEAIDRLGLSLRTLGQQDTEAKFIAIVSALAKVKDEGQRSALGAEIFGKTWKSVQISVANGMLDLAATAPVLSESQIREVAKIEAAWKRLGEGAKHYGGLLAAGLVEGFDETWNRTGGPFIEEAIRRLDLYFDNSAGAMAPPKLPPAPERKIWELPAGATEAEMKALDVALAAQRAEMERYRTAVEAAIKSLSGQDTIDAFRILNAAFDELTKQHLTPGGDALEKYRTQAFDAAEALERLGHAAEAVAARTKAAGTFLQSTPLGAQFAALQPEAVSSIARVLETAPLMLATWYDTPREAIPEWSRLGDTLNGIGDSLEGLGRNLSRLQGPAGQLGSALHVVSQAFREIGDLSKVEQKARGQGDWAGAEAASTQKWLAGMQAASAVIGQFADQSKLAAAASSALSGAVAGFELGGPIGAAVGGIGMGIVGLFGGGPSAAEQANAQATQQIRQYEQSLLDVSGSLQDIDRIGRALGVDLQSVWGATGTMGLTQFTAKMKAFQAAESALMDSLAHGSGVASQALRDLMTAYEQAAGDLRKTADQFYADQLAQAETGLAATLQGMQAAVDAEAKASAIAANLSAGMSQAAAEQAAAAVTGVVRLTEEQASGLGASVAGAFAESISRGASFADTFKALQPAIDTFRAELAAAGVSGGAAFDLIDHMATAAEGTVTGPLVSAIGGANDALRGLYNDGLMNQDMFTGLTETATQARAALVAQGVDGETALLLMQPALQSIFEIQKVGKLTVDATTQALLDQAEAQGIVGDKAESDSQKTVDALQSVADKLGVIADWFTKLLPAAVTQGFETIESSATHLGGVFDDTFGAQNWWGAFGGSAVAPRPGPTGAITMGQMHDGGIVSPNAAGALYWPLGASIARAHTGMLVGPLALAAGEVPIIAQAGEGILSRDVGMPALKALNSGRGLGGGGVDAPALAAAIVRGLREGGVGGDTILNATFTNAQKESYLRDELIPGISRELRKGGKLQSDFLVSIEVKR